MGVQLTVIQDNHIEEIAVERGANLRRTLLANGFTPYTDITKNLNCGGRGLCATCGVLIKSGEPEPTHWHDKIGKSWVYPRLSCQITVNEPMTIKIMSDKIIWGKRNAV